MHGRVRSLLMKASGNVELTRLGMHALATNTVRQHLGLSDAPPTACAAPMGCASTSDWSSMRGVGDVSVIGCVGSLIVATRGVEGVGEGLLNERVTKEADLAWSE